jgi:hypothetical protein
MAAITLSSSVLVDNVSSGDRTSDQLDTNKTIAAYRSLSGFDDVIRAVVLAVSSDVVTPGGAVQVELSNTHGFQTPDIAALSTTKAVVVYRRNGTGNDHIRGCVLDVSGSTITSGTPSVVESDAVQLEHGICGLSSTQALIVFYSTTDSQLQAKILDISGTTITPGTPANITSSGSGWNNISVTKLTSSKAVAVWVDTSTNDLEGAVLDISGSTVTPGSVQTIVSASGTGGMMQKLITAMSTTHAVAGYRSGSDARIIAFSVSGTTITAGSGIQVDTVHIESVVSLSDTQVMVALQSDVLTATLSGTTLTDDANNEALDANSLAPTLAKYDTNKATVLYYDTSATDFEAVTATLPAPAAKFYQGTGSLSEKFDMAFSGLETPGAMAVRDDAKIALGGKEAGGSSEIVTTVVSPYTSETDITDSLTGVPIDSLEWINRND